MVIPVGPIRQHGPPLPIVLDRVVAAVAACAPARHLVAPRIGDDSIVAIGASRASPAFDYDALARDAADDGEKHGSCDRSGLEQPTGVVESRAGLEDLA